MYGANSGSGYPATFNNTGSVIVSNGDTFDLSTLNGVTNSGTITATGSSTLVEIGGTWSNTGLLSAASGATLNLGGTFTTAGFNSITNSGGTLVITGELNNSGTLTVSSPLTLTGTIAGGTIVDASALLALAGGTLTNLVYDGTLALTAAGASIELAGTDTFSGSGGTGRGTINLTGSGAGLFTDDTTTIDNATLNFGGSGTTHIYLQTVNQNADTLTLGPNLSLVQSAAGSQGVIDLYSRTARAGTLINQGTITASASHGFLQVYGASSGNSYPTVFTNTGSVAVSNGDTFDLSTLSGFSNSGTITASGSSTVVEFGGAWTNTGLLSATAGATLNLGGTFTTAGFNSVTNTGGTILISGVLNNTGTLAVNSAVALAGTINGGTISDAGGGLIGQGGTLNAVTYFGTLALTTNSASLDVTGGLNVSTGGQTGVINVTGSSANLQFTNTQTIDNAIVNLGTNGGTDSIFFNSTKSGTQTLTLGSHLAVSQVGGNAQIYYDNSNSGNALVNGGTITAGLSGKSLAISGTYNKDTFTNTGSLVATAGGTLTIAGAGTFTNLVAGTLTGGTYESDAGSVLQLANNVSVVTDAATIVLSGAGSVLQSYATSSGKQVTVDQKLTSVTSTGTLEILGGRSFAASAAFSDAGVLQLGGGGTFTAASGLTIASGGTLTGSGKIAAAVANSGSIEAKGALLTITGAITGTGSLQTDANATLELGAAVASTQTASFSGQGGTLKLDAPLNFAGTIGGFGAGDTLDLAGVSATSATANGATLAVTLGNGGTLAFNLASAVPGERFGTFSDGNGGTDVTAFRYAAGTVAPTTITLANVHVGATDSAAIALTNTAPADSYSEKLDAAFAAAAAGVTTAGTVTALAAGATDASDLSVGINTATAGTISGSATLALSTDGAGTDGGAALSIGSQIFAVSGAVFAYAAGTLAASNVAFGNHHVGDTVRQALTLTNTGPASGGYTERLDATLSGAQGGLSVAGGISQLTQGQTDATSLTLGLSTASAGAISGSATLALASDGAGIDTLGTTALAPISVAGSGGVFAYATAQVAGGTIDLSIHHVGDTVSRALTLTNAGPSTGGYTEALDAMLGGGTGGVTASGALSGLGAGASDTSSLLLGLLTGSAGVKTGTATLTAQSDGAGIDGLGTTALANQTINVTGTIDNYATLSIEQINGKKITTIANGGTIDLGAVAMGAKGPSVKLGILNGATGPADVLGGSFATSGKGYTLKGFSAFSGLTAGKDEEGQTVTLKTTAAGTFSETITVNGTGSNASGYSGGLAAETITITGTVTTGHTPAFLAAAGVAAAAAVGDGVDTGWGAFNAPAGIAANGPPAVGAVPLGWALAGGAYDVLHVAPLHEAPVR